eukprot:TRINITY_DN4242_c0_g2_i1.p1 TRINITY_DN4242_c0_g2~~TRINITY_DN4242_c0_g2_i1.p1  ORF type:complete len:751 (+),score=159.53 TRINITY_DN4242_c0_g2_i1:141-2255(+)
MTAISGIGANLAQGAAKHVAKKAAQAALSAGQAALSAGAASTSATSAAGSAAAASASAASASASASSAAAMATTITAMTPLLAGAAIMSLIALTIVVFKVILKDPDDPMIKIEDRVQEMITDRINKEKRERLQARMMRYSRELALCTSAWISQSAHHNGSQVMSSVLQATVGSSLLQGVGMDAESFHRRASDKRYFTPPSSKNEAETVSPPCLEMLYGNMALERDEWMDDDDGQSLDSLFVPFSLMHAEILDILVDHPPAGSSIDWVKVRSQTAGEYAEFIFGKLQNSWIAQTCRSVRLREKKEGIFKSQYRYELLALVPEFQPNAGKDCWDKCERRTGWCNYCGGKDLGACCKKGEAATRSECTRIDIPEEAHLFGFGKGKHICVHTDCQQEGTKYTKNIKTSKEDTSPENITRSRNAWSKLISMVAGEDLAYETEDWILCQKKCQRHPLCKTWTWYKQRKICNLQDGSGKRTLDKGAISGPRLCQAAGVSAAEENKEMKEAAAEEDKPTKTDEAKQDMPGIPTEEQHPCPETQGIPLDQFDSTMERYVKWCYPKLMKVVSGDFNKFYSRFAKTFDLLANAAGCRETKAEQAAYVDLWDEISQKHDFGEWSKCKWDEQLQKFAEQNKKNGFFFKNIWTPNPEKSKDGSKISFLKQKLLPAFPGPEWLQRRKAIRPCLAKTQIRNREDVLNTFADERPPEPSSN